MKKFSSCGQSLVELLVAIGVSSLVLPALAMGFLTGREGKAQADQRLAAVALLKEGEEAVRSVRNRGWNSFSVNGVYYPQISGSDWALTPGTEVVDSYTRSITIGDVFRDANGKIVLIGGTRDPSTKKIDISVSWNTPFPTDATSTFYLTRYLDNETKVETTVADFNAGTKTNVVVTNNAGGEVQLGGGGKANWCEPALSIPAEDLPKGGVANAISAIEGRVFAGTGENASGVSFANVSISQADPPDAQILGTFDGYKTNDVFGENDYAYLATDNNFEEIVIINLTSSPYSKAGWFNSPGPTDANSIYVAGNIGFATAGSSLYTFDLSSKSGERGQLGVLTLAGQATRVVVVGTYAYVSISDASVEMQIIDVSNPSSMSVVGQADIDSQGAQDVFVNSTGTRAYLVTARSDSQREFFIVDISSKTGSRGSLGSYDGSGMNPKGVVAVPGNRAIIVGTAEEEYQVIDISNENLPVRCGGLSINSGINGISSVLETDGDAFSYIITGDAGSELKIIEGGPGGSVSNNGTFESQTFDPGVEVAFNRIDFTITEPANTDITFQVAVADAVGGSCDGAGFVFVGPDGTSGSFFTQGGATPLNDDGLAYENPGRCFRYKAYLSSTDLGSTPILSDITINYSP